MDKKILIVVDMQNDFIDGSLGTTEAQAIVTNVKKKIEEYKSYGNPIIFTQDTHYADYLNTSEGKMLPVEHCIRLTNGWNIHHDLLEIINDLECLVIEKPTFGSINLMWEIEDMIDNYGNNIELEFVGLCTDICVVSNVLMAKAYYPDLKIVVDASCCAGVTTEKHKAALEVMKSCQVDVIGE